MVWNSWSDLIGRRSTNRKHLTTNIEMFEAAINIILNKGVQMWSVISLREGIIHNTWNSWYRLMNMYSIRKYKVTDWNNKYLISKGATEKRTEKDQKIWSIKFKCKHWNSPTCDCQTEADARVEKSRLQTSWNH